MSIHWLLDAQALLMLIGANTAPVLAAGALNGHLAAPIDANRLLRDGRPLFGSHKTWRGLVSGVLAATLIGGVTGLAPGLGAAFGALALSGDLLSSFTKRRLGKSSGTWMPLLDQLPEALVPLLVLKHWLSMTWTEVAVTAAAFSAIGVVTSRLNDLLARQRPRRTRETAAPKE